MTELKARQNTIIETLNSQSISYDDLAILFGFKTGVALRTYVSRQPGLIKSNNMNIRRVHAALMHPSESLKKIISPDLMQDYLKNLDQKNKYYINYKRRVDATAHMSTENMLALSIIGADIFRVIDPIGTKERLNRVCNRYYTYRNSAEENVIVKSYLEIKSVNVDESEYPNDRTFFQFEHYHPDRIYESDQDEPRTTRGIVFYLNNNLFLIGSTEQGKAPCIFAIREPFRQKFNILLGFTLTANMDHVLFSARTIFVKNELAEKKRIGRIKIGDLTEEEFRSNERFNINLLKNSTKEYIIEPISSIRL